MFGFFRDPHDVIAERNRHEEKMALLGAHPLQWFSKVTRPAGETRWESTPQIDPDLVYALFAPKKKAKKPRPDGEAMRPEEV